MMFALIIRDDYFYKYSAFADMAVSHMSAYINFTAISYIDLMYNITNDRNAFWKKYLENSYSVIQELSDKICEFNPLSKQILLVPFEISGALDELSLQADNFVGNCIKYRNDEYFPKLSVQKTSDFLLPYMHKYHLRIDGTIYWAAANAVLKDYIFYTLYQLIYDAYPELLTRVKNYNTYIVHSDNEERLKEVVEYISSVHFLDRL